MRVLCCGDRKWKDAELIRNALTRIGMYPIIIEGECEGADLLARDVAEQIGFEVIPFPANWARYKLGAGPVRNQQMLDEGKPDLVLAFHDNLLGRSKGTKDMVLRAVIAGVPVRVIRHKRKRRAAS